MQNYVSTIISVLGVLAMITFSLLSQRRYAKRDRLDDLEAEVKKLTIRANECEARELVLQRDRDQTERDNRTLLAENMDLLRQIKNFHEGRPGKVTVP